MTWQPTKVISGGQTGGDQGGLKAAVLHHLQTGGWAPRGWWTDVGPDRSLGIRYGLKEHEEWGYPGRTAANVEDSDGTLFFGNDLSPGGRLTRKLAVTSGKPFYHQPFRHSIDLEEIRQVRRWLVDNRIRTLNVAGNRESSYPGIALGTCAFLYMVFRVPQVYNRHTSSIGEPIDRGTPYGNLFSHHDDPRVLPENRVASREAAILAYHQWIYQPSQSGLRAQIRDNLFNRDLLCCCAPKACHGDILLQVANLPEGATHVPAGR